MSRPGGLGDLDEVPTHCRPQGVGTILDARQLHPHVTVLVDEAAAGRLELAGEYRHMWEAKPSWQGL
ncbi:hypothetical protein ACUXPL_000876 [Micrococcus sp. 140720015-1]